MDLKEIEQFISRRKISFVCSVDREGYPNVKAMLKPRKRNGLKEFWFSTNTSSMRVRQYLENPRASGEAIPSSTGKALRTRITVS